MPLFPFWRREKAPPALDRRVLRRYVSRIYRLLNAGEWTVRYATINDNADLCDRHGIARNTVGFVDEETMTIYVDHRFDVIATLVHECIHVFHPDWDEERVKGLERSIIAGISATQARRLHLLMSNALE